MTVTYLETTVGKSTFRARAAYLYTQGGIWVAYSPEKGRARIGLTDFRQHTSGDVAFVELPAAGIQVSGEEALATVETVKLDLEIPSPFAGVVTGINESLQETAELVNRDPYGAGWLVELQPAVWPVPDLLDAQAYLAVVQAQAEAING